MRKRKPDPLKIDTTTYLLSSPANAGRLLKSIAEMHKGIRANSDASSLDIVPLSQVKPPEQHP